MDIWHQEGETTLSYQRLLKRPAILALPLLVCLLLPGCGSDGDAEPNRIEVNGQVTRGGRLGGNYDLQFIVRGKKMRTALGGTTIPLVGNARVSFRMVQEPDGGVSTLAAREGKTNAGGSVRVSLTLGEKPGVYKLEAALPDHPEVEPVTVVFLGGLILRGNKQDGWVGESLEHLVEVRIESAPRVYEEKATIKFEIRSAPKGSRVDGHNTVEKETNAEGEAGVHVSLGKKQGKGQIGIQVLSGSLGPEAAHHTLTARFFAIDRFQLVIKVLGGLALFIFGMRLMSEGLGLAAGDKLRALLNALTRNRFAAAGVGVLVTGLIQSSSACSVMVIGFVNAGLMQLEQAIAVIMGSNIGTTVTAQMISFKLGSLALPAIAFGVVMLFVAKRSQTRFLAQILIGFGILFLGMSMMSSPLKELKDSLMLKQMFNGLSCSPDGGAVPLFPVLKAVMAGALLTVIVQSSSASIGLLLALAGAELVDVYTGFAILLGGNIGTTITAVLAAIGSTRAAKRTACAHCLFNLIGTVIMVGLLFITWPGTGHPFFMELVARFTDGNVFAGENLPRYLANAHTLFNVSCAVLFIGFVPVFAVACRALITGTDEQEEDQPQRLLDPRLLATPAIAIQQTWAEIQVMLTEGREAQSKSFQTIVEAGEVDWDRITESISTHERDLDELQSAVTEYLSEISMETLTEAQGEIIPRLLHSVNDVERVGDHSMHLLRLARRVRKRSLPFTPDAHKQLREMFSTVEKLFDYCQGAVAANADGHESGPDLAGLRQNLEDAHEAGRLLKKQEHDFRKSHVQRHENGSCDVRSGVVFLDVLLNLNRVGGHLINIIQAATPGDTA